MKHVSIQSPIVSVHWLAKNIDASNLVLLDATIPRVGSKNIGLEELPKIQIKNARFMNMKVLFSDASSEFPNTMLSPEEFSKEARKLGIHGESTIIVYDQFGIYSSPRAWWMFKSMGHHNVAVLDGGLPEWIEAGFEVEKKLLYTGKEGDFTSDYDENFFRNYQEVLDVISNKSAHILDARSADRFQGLMEEPRKGLRSGHIPKSMNLPYSTIVHQGKMASSEIILREFSKMIKKEPPVIFSCGSGITACILALGAEIIGIKKIAVYDGSWTEWGSNLELPIETKSND